MARDPDIDVLIELIGGTTVAKDLVVEALNQGKHVVTANKALLADHGNELFALAESKGVALRFEAAVAGGIPVIEAVKTSLAGNHVSSVAGIINGTGNFILTEMAAKGREFSDVLAEAQALGYAEADPAFDIDGTDAGSSVACPLHLVRASTQMHHLNKVSIAAPADVSMRESWAIASNFG